MNTIVILCGAVDSGKTKTLKGFFKVKSAHSPQSYIERKFDGRIVCAVGFGSPQEQQDFCKVELVNENIQKRIVECENNAKGEAYILLLPFTLRGSTKEGKTINKNCILKPIEKLKEKFKVFVVYLRKTDGYNAERDALMQDVASIMIETAWNDCDKSAELEKFLRQVVIKSH